MAIDATTLVTGAGGFIGGRVTEVLTHVGTTRVRAAVRRWDTAARIGRLPVEIVRCDVSDPSQVEGALDGVTAVIHCAKGTRSVNVEGTRHLLEASLRGNVCRFVFLSSTAVYGDASGDVEEDRPTKVFGDEYADSKIEAEHLCHEYAAQGLPISILRPPIVYGPFSQRWSVLPVQRLLAGRWPLPADRCQGTCNLVYVDDLVAAILAALRRDTAVGEAFNINGPERPTWNDYFSALNAALGLPELRRVGGWTSRVSVPVTDLARVVARFLLDRWKDEIVGIARRHRGVKAIMRKAESALRRAPSSDELSLYGSTASYLTNKARRLLDYQPKFDMQDGVALSVAWLRHHRFV